jgi:hypothetical protein
VLLRAANSAHGQSRFAAPALTADGAAPGVLQLKGAQCSTLSIVVAALLRQQVGVLLDADGVCIAGRQHQRRAVAARRPLGSAARAHARRAARCAPRMLSAT